MYESLTQAAAITINQLLKLETVAASVDGDYELLIKYGYDGSGGHDIRLVFYLLKFEFVLLFYYVYEKIRFVSFAINPNSSRQTMDVGWRPSQRKAWRPITRGSDRSGRSCPVKHPRRTT